MNVSPRTKEKAVEAASIFAANPVVIWSVGILFAGVALWAILKWVLPSVGAAASKAFDGLSGAFSSGVDSTSANLSSILGVSNLSQIPANRTDAQEVVGLVAAPLGDRSLSDLWDNTIGKIIN